MLHPALYIPENARVSEVLREFQRQHPNLALVVDEYGRTVGLVTIEDWLEEIVGEIREEREVGGPPLVSRLPNGALVIDGAATIRDLREQAGLPSRSRPSTRRWRGSSCTPCTRCRSRVPP